jgi:arylsulfatase A-like enzyme
VIDAHDVESPLFLYLAFTAPHTPYQAPQNYLDMYKNIADPLRRAYAAQITAMDDEIGKVLDALDKRKMRDNTLIVFVSDNGGTRSNMFVGEAEVKGELPPNNGPYRDGKGSIYEGGTRVVALANWPGRIKPGVVNEMMHVVDMYPTFAGLAGVQLGKNKPLDGIDVWPTISDGKPSARQDMVYNVEPYRAGVRKGNWKLIWTTLLPPRVELFDLSKDLLQSTIVAPSPLHESRCSGAPGSAAT